MLESHPGKPEKFLTNFEWISGGNPTRNTGSTEILGGSLGEIPGTAARKSEITLENPERNY